MQLPNVGEVDKVVDGSPNDSSKRCIRHVVQIRREEGEGDHHDRDGESLRQGRAGSTRCIQRGSGERSRHRIARADGRHEVRNT